MKGRVKTFNSCNILNKLKYRGFYASTLSTYDVFDLYTTLPHNLIKNKLELSENLTIPPL